MTRSLPVLILSASTVQALGACTTPTSERSSVPGGADPGIEHVHGLGVDPADGVLYAATHYGLFRLPEGGEADARGRSLPGHDWFHGRRTEHVSRIESSGLRRRSRISGSPRADPQG